MKLQLLSILVLGTSAFAIPSPQSTDPAVRPPSSNCGGHTPQPNLCAEGLICAPTQPPGTADFPGTCVMQVCGGKPNNGICPRGLVCVYSSTEQRTDQPGRCLASVLACGSKSGRKCRDGWTCLRDPKIDYEYVGEFSGAGICVPPGF